MKTWEDLQAEAYKKGYQDGYNGVSERESLARLNVDACCVDYYRAGLGDGKIDAECEKED